MTIVWELLEATDPVSWELDPNADPATEDLPGRRVWLPLPAEADAGKVPKVKADGTGYELGTVAGGAGLVGAVGVTPAGGEADVAAKVDGTDDTASTVVVVTTTDDPLTVLLPDPTAVGAFTLGFVRLGSDDLASISYEVNGSPHTPAIYGGVTPTEPGGYVYIFHAFPAPDLGTGSGWSLVNVVSETEWDNITGKPTWIDGFTRPQVIFSRLHIGDGVTEDIDPTTKRLDFPASGTHDGHPSFEIDGLTYAGGTILIMDQPSNANSGVWEPTWDATLLAPGDTPGSPTGWWKGVRPTAINGWVTADLIAEGMTFWVGSGTRYNNTHWTPQWSSNMAPVSGGTIKPVHMTIDHLRNGTTPTDGHALVARASAARGFAFEARAATDHTHTGSAVAGQDEGTAVTNVTGERTLLDSPLSVTATAGEIVKLTAGGTYTNDSGSARVPIFRLNIGGTTMLSWSSSLGNAATVRDWHLHATLRVEANGDINGSGTLSLHTLDIAPSVGTSSAAIQSGATVDLTIQHPTATNLQTASLSYVAIERIRSTIS